VRAGFVNRIAPLKAHDAENEQVAKKSWRTRMKVFTSRRMRCVSALSHEAGEAKIYFYGMICL
jgi:hypothetical protein